MANIGDTQETSEESRGVPHGMITTWVASQKFESRTARIISIVSPVGLSDESRLRLWAMTKASNPTSEPIAEATARRRYFSVKKHKSTAPQPMNRAEEYKLVTGGRPSIYILPASPKV